MDSSESGGRRSGSSGGRSGDQRRSGGSGGSRGSGSSGGRSSGSDRSAGASRDRRPGGGKPSGSGQRPSSGKPGDSRGPRKSSPGGKPKRPGGTGGAGGGGSRGRRDDRREDRRSDGRENSAPPRPRGPKIPEDVDITDLDPAVINELRTLPEDLRELVAGHLVAAEEALVDEDTQLAVRHAAEAKRLAGRVACVREAMGIAAYRNGDYADALAELRAVRRMTGDQSFVPMMADCERGLGRPDRALELLRDARSLPDDVRVEAAIVAAGARVDLGQPEAALLLLDVPERKALPAGAQRARLEYAYAQILADLGRSQEAAEWFAAAAASDIDQVTDAAERLT